MNQDEIIYILQIGEYHRTRNIRVTKDAKQIAKEYVQYVYPTYHHPNIEIWKNGEPVGYFHEVERVESKVKPSQRWRWELNNTKFYGTETAFSVLFYMYQKEPKPSLGEDYTTFKMFFIWI